MRELQQYAQSIACLPFSLPRLWKNNGEKWKTKKWTTLDPSLQVGSPNHELSFKVFFLGLDQFGFPSKMMPYRLNHNLICLG
jgi:hypothetical protein